VISKRHCPFTGIVNFFASADPLMAIGSVRETTPAQYAWHCYLDDPVGGTAPDMAIAETNLKRAIARRRDAARYPAATGPLFGNTQTTTFTNAIGKR
jgi:hypothetical protein